ncbi:hypothetical protein ACNKHR_03870 [Shigella flexneri]
MAAPKASESSSDVNDYADELSRLHHPPDTFMGCTYLAVAGSPAGAAGRSRMTRAGDVYQQCRNTKVAEAEMATVEKKSRRYRLQSDSPADRRSDPGMGGKLSVMKYGTGAVISRGPGHDRRRLRVCQQVRSRHQARWWLATDQLRTRISPNRR